MKQPWSPPIKSFLIAGLFFLCSAGLSAQNLKLLRTESLTSPGVVTKDANRNIFLADGNTIIKLNNEGKQMSTYSSSGLSEIDLLEAAPTHFVYAFDRSGATAYFLTNSLNFTHSVDLHEVDGGYTASLACPGQAQEIWLWERSAGLLVKYNWRFRRVDQEIPLSNKLPDGHELSFMKAHRHLVFVSDPSSGIYIFDAFGEMVKRLPYQGVNHFDFFQNAIYFLHDNSILFYDLKDEREIKIALPEGVNGKYVLAMTRRIFVFTNNQLLIYER